MSNLRAIGGIVVFSCLVAGGRGVSGNPGPPRRTTFSARCAFGAINSVPILCAAGENH